MRLLLRCREASELASRRLDAELPGADLARLRLHLMVCPSCRNVERQLAFIRRAVRQLAAGQGPEP